MPLPDMTLGGTSHRTPGPVPPAPEPVEVDDFRDDEVRESANLPVVALEGGVMSPSERAQVAVRHLGRQVAAQVRYVTSRPDGVKALQPESYADYDAYRKSRAWLPEGHRGGWLETVPAVYYATVGKLGFVCDGLGRSCFGAGWVFKRMLRFVVAAGLVLAVLTFWIFN